MKKKTLVFLILISVCTGVVAAESADVIRGLIVNYDICVKGQPVNDRLQYPLLSYNDTTYMSVRDAGALFSKQVEWVESENSIWFREPSPYSANEVIKKPETAMAIGKAVIEEYYSERLNDNSIFYVGYARPTTEWRNNYHYVDVLFDPPADVEMGDLYIINNSDVEVEIHPMTGSVTIKERQLDGDWKNININS